MLELDNVRKYYQSPGEVVHAVDGISLTVGSGELVAIYGPSGSGKTTLLLLAAGLLRPDAGKVSFRDTDLAMLSEREAADYRRRTLGFIFQNYNLIPGMNAVENVALPIMLSGAGYRSARKAAAPMMELVGLDHRARHLPSQLSGGERQRVAIARALAGKPKLILADEPTGNLDTERGHEILSLLGSLSREHDVGVILVTHDADAAGYADRIATLRDGALIDGAEVPHVAVRAAETR